MTATTAKELVSRHFATEGVDPYDEIAWERRDARIGAAGQPAAFEQSGVEFPAAWSHNASNIVSQKYFRGHVGAEGRESSLRQVIDRVVDTLTAWGLQDGHLGGEAEADAFAAELRWLLVNQRLAFNSPVWFNVGVVGVRQQGSACFILSVDDTMESILDWYGEEGRIFKGGSGAGVNLSRIRASSEKMAGGGTPSGPVSFMRGADASAGTIKSGGKTRRAAKMVILDADHPDVAEFVECKTREERKAQALAAAGFDMSLDGADVHSVQYQNANHSVRLSDEFMQAALGGRGWDLVARTTGEVVETVDARELLAKMAQSAWECADPGVQFDTTINRWNTAANTGRINASNPCSEYLHLDNSACNLASLNLKAFLDPDTGSFDVAGFEAAVATAIVAQDILVDRGEYPTEEIGRTTRRFRQLGLGYTNLGAALMTLGLAYDSDAGRGWAAAVTALMCGTAYATSAAIAGRLGAFAGYGENREPTLRVLGMHRDALGQLEDGSSPSGIVAAARKQWDCAVAGAGVAGVRNSQVTVLAPTGTISFMMDCDTTGIEPDLGLVKTKTLVGGGTMAIVNHTVPSALQRLGYDDRQRAEVMEWVQANGTAEGAPHLSAEHRAVFACSMGDGAISPGGHIKMMAAVQPWLSGGISKTVNLPEDTTVADIEQVFFDAWHMGVKAVAVYRDNCKLGQPLKLAGDGGGDKGASGEASAAPKRLKLPRTRSSRTFEFRVADCKGFATVGEYDDGRPGEIFIKVSKQGSTLAGVMDGFAMAVSHGLQYGVPLESFVAAFCGMRFEPAGMTDDPDIRIASSLMDYLFRRLAVEYLDAGKRGDMGIYTTDERTQPTLPGVEEATVATFNGADLGLPLNGNGAGHSDAGVVGAPVCSDCGTFMRRAGACWACTDCGATSGCS